MNECNEQTLRRNAIHRWKLDSKSCLLCVEWKNDYIFCLHWKSKRTKRDHLAINSRTQWNEILIILFSDREK